ncbi:Crp/Fnr family transcriptional regulator [Aureibacter tunicatorum]|uniref:CRP-like cAMP-binding protein n=1 Tax=Aureibacter tunicatorum TaxID=866807 RepID=A0AAE4BSD5_9BACT|nr:Crp/Fnr family transcriptional regulator [Aureibacter tunicatorum]MDR6238750.1 CRP-like cAMP-binding protein [Aureibacter tunicatorum]BDD05319.1 cAMP-binding protein [Aureibacter tunicatorum]
MDFSEFTLKKVSKGDILQREGDETLRSYFVKKGLLRSYVIDAKGKEHIFLLAPEGWIIGDVYAINHSKETNLFIDALEASEVLVIDETIDAFSNQEIKAGVEKLLKRIGVLQNRILMQMSSSALERYEHFLEMYPGLTQRVPQRMIASYLGITPQALSRIRSNSAKKLE